MNKILNKTLYRCWWNMKTRCYNNKVKRYKDYGGRGIKICNEWLNDYKTFEKWAIDTGWAEGLQIDRINNNGNYEPDNCRWVTSKINANNKRVYLSTLSHNEKLICSTDNRIEHLEGLIEAYKKKIEEYESKNRVLNSTMDQLNKKLNDRKQLLLSMPKTHQLVLTNDNSSVVMSSQRDAAKYLDVSVATIQRALYSGKLCKGYRIDRLFN